MNFIVYLYELHLQYSCTLHYKIILLHKKGFIRLIDRFIEDVNPEFFLAQRGASSTIKYGTFAFKIGAPLHNIYIVIPKDGIYYSI